MKAPTKAPVGETFCIFCGVKPREKNREHVIPQWLLNFTGSSSRSAYFGREWHSDGFRERKFSWKSFTLPACEACNTRWSSLEARIKIVFDKMTASEPLASREIYEFLDWMDKVRVGLWFSMYYLNKNYRGLIPQFHVDDRVGQQDRILLIYEALDWVQGIGLVGIDSPIFHSMPSVLYFIVNQFHFVSVSKPFFLSERFGWPAVREARFQDIDTDGFFAEIVPVTNEIQSPILASPPRTRGTMLFQPISHPACRSHDDCITDNIVKNSQPGKIGVGKLFIGNAPATPYPNEPSIKWIPSFKYLFHDLVSELSIWSANLQRELFLDQPEYSHFSAEDRAARDAEIRGIVAIHDLMVKHDFDGTVP